MDMDKIRFTDRFEEGLQKMGLSSIEPEKLTKLFLYQEILSKWNQKINLTAHRVVEISLERNFLDCLPLIPLLSQFKEILDLGSGAGFPGLVVQICLPESKVILVESDQRKAVFLETVIRELGLSGGTVENIFLDQKKVKEMGWSNRYEALVSRATIQPEKILPLVGVCLKSHGYFFAMMNSKDLIETNQFEGAGLFSLEREIDYRLPFSGLQRKIVIFRKE